MCYLSGWHARRMRKTPGDTEICYIPTALLDRDCDAAVCPFTRPQAPKVSSLGVRASERQRETE